MKKVALLCVKSSTIIGLIICLFLISLLTACSIDQHLKPTVKATEEVEPFEGMKVRFLSVPKGEVSLIQFPNDYNVLVDTGGEINGNRDVLNSEDDDQDVDEMDDEKTLLINQLNRFEVNKIDLLILTNGMEGHIGGLDELFNNIPVKKVIVPELIKEFIVNSQIMKDAELINVVEGDVLDLPLEAKIKILFPGEPLSLSPQANSLVFILQHKEIRFLFTSDINDQVELRLKEKYDLRSQILKVSDGGSIHASHSEFLQEVDAHVAVVFSGHGEATGREEVLERLSETWIDVYQTKIHGTVTILSTGDDYQVEKDK